MCKMQTFIRRYRRTKSVPNNKNLIILSSSFQSGLLISQLLGSTTASVNNTDNTTEVIARGNYAYRYNEFGVVIFLEYIFNNHIKLFYYLLLG